MKKMLISSAVAVLFIVLFIVPAHSQESPFDGQEPENTDIILENTDEAELFAFADMIQLDGEFEDIDIAGRGGNKGFSRGFDGKRPGRQWIHDSLNLTDEQENKIEALRLDHQRKMIDLRANLQKAKLDAREVRNNDKLSRSSVITAVEKINKVRNEITLARANHRMDVYEVLTPEQQKIWQDLKNDFSGRKLFNRGGGMMDGGGLRRHMMR